MSSSAPPRPFPFAGAAPLPGSRRASHVFGAADTENLLQPARSNIVIAFDIGTYGSGFVYTTGAAAGSTSAPRVYLHTDWPDKPPGEVYPKTRSALLLKANRGAAFGYSAERRWADMSEEQRREGRYTLVYGTAFKLGLQDPSRAAGELPTGVTPEDAFREFLRLLRAYAMDHLRATHGSAGMARGAVRYCLTVPAMWSEGAKAAVRKAALHAGLIGRIDSDDLTVALEPEAAALHVSAGAARPRLFPAAGGAAATAAAPLAAGEVVLVADLGGGTSDFTVHEVELRGDTAVLSEVAAVPGRGIMVGGTDVDAAFEAAYRAKVGEEFYDEWKAAHPRDWQAFMSGHWEQRLKHHFDGSTPPRPDLAPAGPAAASASAPTAGGEEEEFYDGDDDDWEGAPAAAAARRGPDVACDPFAAAAEGYRVPIPPTLHALLDEAAQVNLVMEFGFSDSVTFSRAEVAGLFAEAVSRVKGALGELLAALEAAPAAPASRPSKVLLVGGFGASPHLQFQLAAALAGRCGQGLMVPERPAEAVVLGAATYGLRPELIRARASRLTYGVRTAVPYEEGMPGKFWHPSELCYYSSAGFSPFVARGQLVAADEVVTHVFTPLSREQHIASVELWASDQVEVPYLVAAGTGTGAAAERRGSSSGGSEAGGVGGGAEGGENAHLMGQLEVILVDPEDAAEAAGTSAATATAAARRRRTASADDDCADERLIEVTLEFGRTEIKVKACDLLTGQRYTTRGIKFAFS